MNNHSLTISKIIHRGYGLGRLDDGKLAMVRQVLPDEVVDVSIIEVKKNHVLCTVKKITTESPTRIDSPCSYYGDCGGCDLQHADYAEQLRIKTAIVADLLTRQLPRDQAEQSLELLQPTLPSPSIFGYRQRIRLKIDSNHRPGFNKHRSHQIVAITTCLIARDEINSVLAELLQISEFTKLTTRSSELELLWNPDKNNIYALFLLTRKPRPADFAAARNLLSSLPLLAGIYFAGEGFQLRPAAPGTCDSTLGITYQGLSPAHPTTTFHWEVAGFCQVNLEQNRNLIELVLKFADPQKHETLLDLFCGNGNFSIPLAILCQSLTGIEGQGAAVRSAKANSQAAGCRNTEFIKGPIHTACKALLESNANFDCIVVDPPRQGIPALAPLLAKLCRSKLVYISCDPATLCRDLSELTTAGFQIRRIQPVDMFPQTHHIETVVLLEKN